MLNYPPVSKPPTSAIADNRAARHHYEILEEFVAGMQLTGAEVKSIRRHQVSFAGSYITLDSTGQAWLRSLDIAEYKYSTQPHERKRERKLLLHQRELAHIAESLTQKGLTAIPLNLHISNNHIKLRFALARGKKHYDKRESLKKRDITRELHREAKLR